MGDGFMKWFSRPTLKRIFLFGQLALTWVVIQHVTIHVLGALERLVRLDRIRHCSSCRVFGTPAPTRIFQFRHVALTWVFIRKGVTTRVLRALVMFTLHVAWTELAATVVVADAVHMRRPR